MSEVKTNMNNPATWIKSIHEWVIEQLVILTGENKRDRMNNFVLFYQNYYNIYPFLSC